MIHLVYKNPSAERHVSHVGLGVTASHLAQSLTRAGIDAIVYGVKNGEEMEQIVRKEKPEHLVMCASFIDSPWLSKFFLRHPDTQFIVCLHSNPAFLAIDNFATKTLIEHIKLQEEVPNFSIAGNSTRYVEAVRRTFSAPCLYLPNLYPIGPKPKPNRWNPGDFAYEPIRIGMFGAIRQLKNHMNGLWASMLIGKMMDQPVEFYINADRIEHGDGILKSLIYLSQDFPDFKLIQVPWQSWKEHRKFCSTMHLGMQPSFTESFNNVTADFISEGVPTVVGTAIDWVPSNWQANPDDVIDIALTGQALLKNPYTVCRGHKYLTKYHKDGILEWKKSLNLPLNIREHLAKVWRTLTTF